MFADLFFVGVLLVGGLIGTFTDIKTREVPDFVNYFLIAVGIGGHAILSVLEWSFWPLVYSLAAAGIFCVVAHLLFYSGTWGGGDAKMLIGFGALLPVYPASFLAFLSPNLAPWPFLFSLFLNILLFGALYGVLFSAGLAIRHRKKFLVETQKLRQKKIIKVVQVLLCVLFIVPLACLFLDWSLFFYPAAFWALGVGFLYLGILAKGVENACMYKFVKPSALTEGDWLATDVRIGGRVVYKKSRTGIELKDIKMLIKLEQEGKLERVKIKEGIPYVPAFLFGVIATLVWGDIIFRIISGAI